MIEWETLSIRFTQTFEFTSEHPTVDVSLQVIKENIFEEILVVDTDFHQCSMTIHNLMQFYNLTGEPDDDEPLEINIPESEGMSAVEGVVMYSDQFLRPLKIKKVNIGSAENPKSDNIGDYWDDETVGKITDLLHEFQDMFPTKFFEMKAIVGDLGEMKIPLRLYAKSVKQRPHRLNPRYKEKFKAKLDRIL